VTPSWTARSPDGTQIAVFSSGVDSNPPLVLVHGATADHTTFRVVGPMFAERFAVHAIDRRGRGASGDGSAYSIEREFEDVAAVADALAARQGGAIDVLGHSYGGRCCLGAALRTEAIRRLVVYEGAPQRTGIAYSTPEFIGRFEALVGAGQPDVALELFYRTLVGMDDETIAYYRSSPTWAARVAAAATVPRELWGEGRGTAGALAFRGLERPVLQIVGSESPASFREAAVALNAELPDCRLVVIDGAAHAAHHTHPDAFVAAATEFLLGAA
jgi:pimeloyl-ACP methyl ester carboxylesterase